MERVSIRSGRLFGSRIDNPLYRAVCMTALVHPEWVDDRTAKALLCVKEAADNGDDACHDAEKSRMTDVMLFHVVRALPEMSRLTLFYSDMFPLQHHAYEISLAAYAIGRRGLQLLFDDDGAATAAAACGWRFLFFGMYGTLNDRRSFADCADYHPPSSADLKRRCPQLLCSLAEQAIRAGIHVAGFLPDTLYRTSSEYFTASLRAGPRSTRKAPENVLPHGYTIQERWYGESDGDGE